MATKRVLTAKDRFALWTFIGANYTASNMTDKEFARYAGGELKFDVTEGHVYHGRTGLDIPAKQPKKANNLEQRVTDLEALVKAMRTELGMQS